VFTIPVAAPIFIVPVITPIFTALVVAPIFIILVIAPIFIVPKAPYLYLGLIALCRVFKKIKSIRGIPDTAYSLFNKLLTQRQL